MKTSENLGFSDVFRGYRNVTFGEHGLTWLVGLGKLRSSEKVEILQIGLILPVT